MMPFQLSLFDWTPEVVDPQTILVDLAMVGQLHYRLIIDDVAEPTVMAGAVYYSKEDADAFVNLVREAGGRIHREHRDSAGAGSFVVWLPFEIDWKAAEAFARDRRFEALKDLQQRKPEYFLPNGALDVFKLVRVHGWAEA